MSWRTARFAALAANPAFFIDEAELAALGDRHLQDGPPDAAIAVFENHVSCCPASWNVYDSLGEAYAIKGDRTRAAELYRRSFKIDPANPNATAALKRLAAGSPECFGRRRTQRS